MLSKEGCLITNSTHPTLSLLAVTARETLPFRARYVSSEIPLNDSVSNLDLVLIRIKVIWLKSNDNVCLARNYLSGHAFHCLTQPAGKTGLTVDLCVYGFRSLMRKGLLLMQMCWSFLLLALLDMSPT